MVLKSDFVFNAIKVLTNSSLHIERSIKQLDMKIDISVTAKLKGGLALLEKTSQAPESQKTSLMHLALQSLEEAAASLEALAQLDETSTISADLKDAALSFFTFGLKESDNEKNASIFVKKMTYIYGFVAARRAIRECETALCLQNSASVDFVSILGSTIERYATPTLGFSNVLRETGGDKATSDFRVFMAESYFPNKEWPVELKDRSQAFETLYWRGLNLELNVESLSERLRERSGNAIQLLLKIIELIRE
ncbi:MAG: hypothetical protein P1V97_26390 [Planctomycetota bacterium]|nr:hypothetical protein [Planctomycetota bacterium]